MTLPQLICLKMPDIPMRHRFSPIRFFLLMALPFMVIAMGNGWDSSGQQGIYRQKLDLLLRSVKFHDGDLIFRRGKSMASQAVLLTDHNSMYSHVGMICMIGQVPYVIHAVPGESGSGPEEIKCEKLTSFLDFEKASRGGLYRLSQPDSPAIGKALQQAKQAFDKRVKFDEEYDLKSDDKLYCTELIWKSYLVAGVDLVQGQFDLLSIPLRRGKYILPGTFLNSQSLISIYTY